MNNTSMLALALAVVAAVQAQDVKPTWELGKNPIDPATMQGKIEWVDGLVKLDARNSFEIPIAVLGKQEDYTIEFEVKCGAGFKNLERMEGALRLIDFSDVQAHAGMAFIYFPPAWDNNGGCDNAIGMMGRRWQHG